MTSTREEGREDFPNCGECPYWLNGPWRTCVNCANEQLPDIADPCPVCSQEQNRSQCRNRLCTSTDRLITKIEATTLHTRSVRRLVSRYKYDGKSGWAHIFGRLLLGHLETRWDPSEVDLIIANPGHTPQRNHTQRVLDQAAIADLTGRWPFDTGHESPTLTKTSDTPQSAGKNLNDKQRAAVSHRAALTVNRPEQLNDARIIIYDDICTTGITLNEVAKLLVTRHNAQTVTGIVLARQPWS